MKNALTIPYVFVMMNWAAVMGLVHYLRGDRDVWKPDAAPTPVARSRGVSARPHGVAGRLRSVPARPRAVPAGSPGASEGRFSRAEDAFRSSLVHFHRPSS